MLIKILFATVVAIVLSGMIYSLGFNVGRGKGYAICVAEEDGDNVRVRRF